LEECSFGNILAAMKRNSDTSLCHGIREDVMATCNFFQYEALLFQYGYYFLR
jgi:hypothetical protein